MSDALVRIWDSFVRGYHWALLLLLGGLWITGGDLDYIDLHKGLGFTVLALILSRIMWGIGGSQSARFSDFVRSPIAGWRYLGDEIKGRAREPLGHNPAGAYMILLMLALVLAQAVSGLFTDDEIFFRGPLAHWVNSDTAQTLTRFHRNNFDWVLIAIGLHVLAILFYMVRGKDLITPMFTGNKDRKETVGKPPRMINGGWGFLIFLVNMGWIFWWLW